MSLKSTMVRDDAVRAVDGGIEVAVHLPWFRSLPLSCIEECRMAIAGREVPADDVLFRIGSDEWSLADLAGLSDREWFVLDQARLFAPGDQAQQPGATVEISVELAIRIPDIIIGPNRAFVSRQRVTKRVMVT